MELSLAFELCLIAAPRLSYSSLVSLMTSLLLVEASALSLAALLQLARAPSVSAMTRIQLSETSSVLALAQLLAVASAMVALPQASKHLRRYWPFPMEEMLALCPIS